MPRLFVGLAVPPALAERWVEAAADALGGPAVRRYPPRDLHLTLLFLGDSDQGAAVARALVDETRGLLAPELRLAGLGVFPEVGPPRVYWAGIAEALGTEGRLAALRSRAEGAARRYGWRPSAADRARPFRPHVTLARAPADAAACPAFLGLRPRGEWVASEVGLYESDPTRTHARYALLAEAPLAVRPG